MPSQYQQGTSPAAGSSSGTSTSSSATRSSDKDRENRARIQAYYVTQEPFQIAQMMEQQQKERQQMMLEMARREEEARKALEVPVEVGEKVVHEGGEKPTETTITLGQQSTTFPLEQVPAPFVLPDVTSSPQEQPTAPVLTNNALPVIVSSSAESNEAPQIVNVPEHQTLESHEPGQSSSDDDKTLPTEESSGSGGKLGGILSNWAPAAAALKRPLGMQRSLSEFFGLKSPLAVPEATDDDRTPPAQPERRVSHSSTASDGSSLLDDGKSGLLYCRAKQKRGSTDATGSGWNLGERRGRRLPEGASGVALHKDLWKLDQMSETCDLPECSVVFSFTNRRHHCRMCGQIFCTPHASFALDLWYPPTKNGDGFRSTSSSRRGSRDATDDVPVSRSPDQPGSIAPATNVTASTNSLLRLPVPGHLAKEGIIKPARVCEDCYDKVRNPERYIIRERARRAAPTDAASSGLTVETNDSDSQASNSGFSLALDQKASSAAHLLNERVLQRSRSLRSTGRRMFSAPVSPASTSPTNAGDGLDAAVHSLISYGASATLSRQGSRSSSLAPPGARQNARLARHASAHGALSLRNRMPSGISGSAFDNVTPRPMFSPTAEALNVSAQQRSLSPNRQASTSGNGYFPAMPPPSKPYLPGEEPNQHVNGVLSNYPLAYKPASSGSTATSPFTSGPPSSADLKGLAPRMGQGSGRPSPGYMRIDMPKSGFMLDDPMSSKASSAKLLTPDREWVPGAWGYAKETYDPDVETDTEDEEEHVNEVDSLAKRTRSRLIVDGEIRLKTRSDVGRENKVYEGQDKSQIQQSSTTRSMPWSTF